MLARPLAILALVAMTHITASPLPRITARAPILKQANDDDDDKRTKQAEPTQVTIWQRPNFKDKQFATANSNLVFADLGRLSLDYNNVLGKIKATQTLTTKMKGQDAAITATLKEKILADDDSYEETAAIKGDDKEWEDIISCSITDEEKKLATCVLKHYAEGDPDTVTATATSVGLKQGKLKVYPLVHVNEEALSDGYKSATAAYASFTATDER